MADLAPGGAPTPHPDNPATGDEGRVSVVVLDNDLQTVRTPLEPDPEEPGAWGSYYQKTDEEVGVVVPPATTWDKIRVPMFSFVRLRFPDPKVEREYQKENAYAFKPIEILCSAFFILFWVLTIAFVPHTLYTDWSYIGICGLCTIPLPLLVIFDVRKRVPWLYQVWVACAAWCWGAVVPVEMTSCGFYREVNQCGDRSYLFFFASLVMHPTLALLLLGQDRIVHIVMATAWLVYGGVIFMTQPRVPASFARNLILLEVYHIFLASASYYRDRTLRQLFYLRTELKEQYRAVQAAQVLERKANESKKRFVSYIFHEVRVPLNTALLAAQNLDEEGVFGALSQDHRDMIHGLMGSLDMMEQVLNDVLSFNRMEAGHLEQARKPFDFHKTINVVALLHRVHAERANLYFHLELDPRIDELGGVVIGDEMRLRQVTSNLVSNALKFTRTGGVRVRTKLVAAGGEKSETCDGVAAAIRVEVHDTGVGLRPVDVENERLFSPYVQTEIGRRQGGKGSGLGLALVHQIIRLSGGRLGIESVKGKGSTFWFEIPYTLLPGRPSGISSMPSTPADLDLTRLAEKAELGPPLRNDEPNSPVEPPDREPPLGVTPENTTMSQLSVLVVDDDTLTRQLMGRMIRRLGHRVVFAENGKAAMEIIRAAHDGTGPPLDIVFLDNQMPIMSGVEVAREVRAMGCGIRIVGCTGNALQEDQTEYLKAGADAVCPKPLRQVDIVAHLQAAR